LHGSRLTQSLAKTNDQSFKTFRKNALAIDGIKKLSHFRDGLSSAKQWFYCFCFPAKKQKLALG